MDIAAFLTWIRETIMKMGGMQTCDLVYEETNPEGQFLQMLRYVHSRHKYRACMAHICNFLKTELRGLRSFPLCPQIVCINNCITIIPFVRSLSRRGSFRCISLFHWTDAKSYGMVAYVQQWLSKWFKSYNDDDDDDDGDGDRDIVISIITI